MSSNNQLIIYKIKSKFCVFENGCVDNAFKKPKDDKDALFMTNNLIRVIRWANEYAKNNFVEYGVDIRL